MSFNKTKFTSLFISLLTIHCYCQQDDKKQDSITVERLEEVVITGQYSAQSINKSVHEVTVINRAQIEAQAGNNLADVLNQTLNINVIPSASTGKSSVQLFGLDSQYFKILVDDIPLVSDEGLGNNADLSQINLDDIEQIEIVEGAMGVQYGANAVSGVINIITKKRSKYKWLISPYVQEETIGNEFNFSNKGRHIQSLKIGHNFSKNLYSNVIYTRNDFNGFFDNQKGRDHFLNDDKRGHSWLPKLQNTVKLLVNYKGKNSFKSFYKFEYFTENIHRFSRQVNPNFNPATQTTNPIGDDAYFNTERLYNLLNFTGKIKEKVHYNLSFSYQQQTRNTNQFKYFIKLRQKFDEQDFEYESRKVLYSKGNFSNFLTHDFFNFQLGYEVNEIRGFSSSVSGSFDGKNIKRTLGSYDVFGSAELSFNDEISVRPGVRVLTSSLFKTQLAVSLSTKFLLKNKYELRFVVGTSPKLPNYAELYTFFVDANHDVRGNPNLKPEQGRSIFVHLKKKINFSEFRIQSKLSLNYLDVLDRIELGLINLIPLQSKYINIDVYKTIGAFLNNSFTYKNTLGSIGIGYSGQSKVLDSREIKNDDYLFSLGVNTNFSFKIKPLQSTLSVFYKYNGAVYQFVQQTDEFGNTILTRGKQSGYSMLNTSFQKYFLQKKLNLTLGVRNLLNVTQVTTTAVEGATHSDAPSNTLLGYGRSYFFKLIYNLNFN